MKEQDLKRCFSKIKPSESLIRSTTEKIGELGPAREKAGFRFSYRLASAMCALVLVIGLGVAVLYNPTMIPTADGTVPASQASLVSGRTAEDAEEATSSVKCDAAVIERMSKDGESVGADYAVFFGTLDGCYFGEVTPEDTEQGVMYHCILMFSVNPDDVIFSDECDHPYIEDGLVRADVYVYDAQTMESILSSTASYMYARLSYEDGSWIAEELLPYTEE